jgi:hypothetical protein
VRLPIFCPRSDTYMKEIDLPHNQVALVDDEDYERCKNIKWHMGAKGYVMSNKGVYLHRFIMNTPKGLDTDHIKGNKLDNRKSKLRVATRSQNNVNKGKSSKNAKSSKFKGVCWDKNRERWMAFTTYKNRFISFGRFDNELEAARIYNDKIIKYYKGFAKLNEV